MAKGTRSQQTSNKIAPRKQLAMGRKPVVAKGKGVTSKNP